MAINPVKTLLFAGGGVIAVAGVAYVSGALDPLLKPAPPAQVAALPSAGSNEAAAPQTQQPAAQTPAPGSSPLSTSPAPAGSSPAANAGTVPSFDVVRAESNGSLVIAGKAAPNAKVDILNGSTVIGSATAGPAGDFAAVLDDPLKPGDYQLTLRSTTPENATANSSQTAVVSIPDKADGQVLAMVEEAGKPSELLTVPEPAKPADMAAAETPVPTTGSAVGTPAQSGTDAKSAEAASEPVKPAAEAPKIAVEAVEIDGSKVFVAGTAEPGSKVRAYASDILLGDALTSPDGHFLVEATRELPVGNYTVRVDALDGSGKVVARAAVPFEREPGEAIAAVAPSQPPVGDQQATEQKAAETAPAQPGPAQASAPEAEPAADMAASGQPANSPASQPAGEKPADVAAATPSQPTETTAPKLQHADGAVIIRRGDSLWRISRRIYGHGVRYSTIYLANQEQISDPDRIWPGQIFKVPEKSSEGETADMKAMGEQATIR